MFFVIAANVLAFAILFPRRFSEAVSTCTVAAFLLFLFFAVLASTGALTYLGGSLAIYLLQTYPTQFAVIASQVGILLALRSIMRATKEQDTQMCMPAPQSQASNSAEPEAQIQPDGAAEVEQSIERTAAQSLSMQLDCLGNALNTIEVTLQRTTEHVSDSARAAARLASSVYQAALEEQQLGNSDDGKAQQGLILSHLALRLLPDNAPIAPSHLLLIEEQMAELLPAANMLSDIHRSIAESAPQAWMLRLTQLQYRYFDLVTRNYSQNGLRALVAECEYISTLLCGKPLQQLSEQGDDLFYAARLLAKLERLQEESQTDQPSMIRQLWACAHNFRQALRDAQLSQPNRTRDGQQPRSLDSWARELKLDLTFIWQNVRASDKISPEQFRSLNPWESKCASFTTLLPPLAESIEAGMHPAALASATRLLSSNQGSRTCILN